MKSFVIFFLIALLSLQYQAGVSFNNSCRLRLVVNTPCEINSCNRDCLSAAHNGAIGYCPSEEPHVCECTFPC